MPDPTDLDDFIKEPRRRRRKYKFSSGEKKVRDRRYWTVLLSVSALSNDGEIIFHTNNLEHRRSYHKPFE